MMYNDSRATDGVTEAFEQDPMVDTTDDLNVMPMGMPDGANMGIPTGMNFPTGLPNGSNMGIPAGMNVPTGIPNGANIGGYGYNPMLNQ